MVQQGPASNEPSAGEEVTRILSAVEGGDPRATSQLLPLVYSELQKLAAAKMAHEKPGQTLQATALVHEAYLRLVDVKHAQHWNSCGHFFCAAGEAMRRILVERARRKRHGSVKPRHDIVMSHVADEVNGPNLDVLALNEALDKLAIVDPRATDVVKLRFFAGLTRKEAAQALNVSLSTVDTDWAYAKSWLQLELDAEKSKDTDDRAS
jgi:RNA polymerase sigma factor (TIGR02999 family)